MRKQFHKIKVAAENFSVNRSTKLDKNADELHDVEKQVEKYREVLQTIAKKISSNASASQAGQDAAAREKRLKKIHEFMLGQIMEDSSKDLPDGLFKKILDFCAKLEKTIASEIVNNELNIENEVSKNLNSIIETHVAVIQKQKRTVTKCTQDNEAAKAKHQAAQRLNEQTKISQAKDDQEECETRLEKERDIYASNMFDLLAEEENIASYVVNYVRFQQMYFKSALDEIELLMTEMNSLLRHSNKKVFNVALENHLETTNRKISYVIEMCVCCLLEKGLYEEGLLRVGCSNSKLKRMKSAIDASFVGPPIPLEYQDVHVVASVLKSYLRSLPDPMLTHHLYYEFLEASQKNSEEHRKAAILNAINKLPEGNHANLKYLTKFLSYLSEKHGQNKMSTQNIAIVMSPNLLWPPNENGQDYAQQVNSTAYVNTIVEALIADWEYFFEGDVNFYVTMTRDDLFPDNGGFPYDKDKSVISNAVEMMSKSMGAAVCSNATSQAPPSSNSHYNGGNQTKQLSAHSRSSSHDTSLILLGEQVKKSQSSSSLSDHSSPTQGGSPKLPTRRKHKAPIPPTPENTKGNSKSPASAGKLQDQKICSVAYSKFQDTSSFSFIDDLDPTTLMDEHRAALKKAGSVENLLKPSKPPRPAAVSVECQTLNRTLFKTMPPKTNNVTEKPEKPASLPAKPVALPRTFSKIDGDETVLVREKAEKPTIPERPASLMRPPSFRGPSSLPSEQSENIEEDQAFKKAGSFRGDHSNQSKGSVEVTQMYNIDKKQIAIVDVIGSPVPQRKPLSNVSNSSDSKDSQSPTRDGDGLDFTQVPPSPRAFDKMIKRPQVPPPNRPKSDASDSTNL